MKSLRPDDFIRQQLSINRKDNLKRNSYYSEVVLHKIFIEGICQGSSQDLQYVVDHVASVAGKLNVSTNFCLKHVLVIL